MSSSFNFAAGGEQKWWHFSDALGIIIRVRDTEGQPLPKKLVNTTQVSRMVVEQDLGGRRRVREQLPQKARVSIRYDSIEGDGDSGKLSEQTQLVIRVLQRNFPTMIHAFALFDADDGNAVGLAEVRNAIKWLYQREKGKRELVPEELEALACVDAKAFIRDLSRTQVAGRGTTLSLNDFVCKISFGDTVEDWQKKLEVARKERNKMLEEEISRENNVISSRGTEFLGELKACLQTKFENAAEAFVFFDRGCKGVLSEVDWKIGLRRLGLHLNVRHLLMVLDGNGSVSDGKIDEGEFLRFFAWHSLEKVDRMMLEAKKNRKAVSNRITMSLFKANEKKLPSLTSPFDASLQSSRDNISPKTAPSVSLSNNSFVVGNNTYDGSRGTVLWQTELISRVAAAVKPPANSDRFLFVGFQGNDIVLGIMPDASDWKRTPKLLAQELREALSNPENSLRTWDPSVQGLSTTFILNTNKWNFTTVAGKGIFDESLTNSMLREKLPFRRDHLIIPRSDVGFKTLGALDHWRCIDGIGKVGAVRDRFALSLLRHTDGTFLELMHFSPGFFLFQAVPGGAVLCCDESARVRQRSDLSLKGDGKGPAWNFHSPATVEQYKTDEGQDLKERFAKLTSSVPGRWIVGISVPHVFIENRDDKQLQIVLTSHGFVVLGGGPDPQGLIVEKGRIKTCHIHAAFDYVRHLPAKPDDQTELDKLRTLQNASRIDTMASLQTILPVNNVSDLPDEAEGTTSRLEGESVQTMYSTENWETIHSAELRDLKLELETSFQNEMAVQQSHLDMLLSQGFRDCCTLLSRLNQHLSVGEILDASERINRRAQLVRVCGDYGKQWVPGTGTSTELAFLIDDIRTKLAKKRLNMVFVHFFRMEYHKPHNVIAHIIRQLSANISENETCLTTDILKALNSHSHELLAGVLHDLCMHHMLKDTPVIIVLDNLHLAEQRVLGFMIYKLRKALQPWEYQLKRQGYVRVVFSGRDGYSVPSGTPIASVQLNRLSDPMAKHVLTKMFRNRKKHISVEHIAALVKKKDAARMQYLRVAVSIVQRYWVFEQINGYIEALPEQLCGLYALSIRNLEDDFGENLVEEILLLLANANEENVHSFAGLKKSFASNSKASALLEALRELLRIAPSATQCQLVDEELRAAILLRYDGKQKTIRAQEAQAKVAETKLRQEQLESCVASVVDPQNGIETGCSNLHQAIDSAAAGNEVIICKKHITLKKGLMVDRELKISCRKADTVVSIGYGQTLLQVGDDELHFAEPQARFTVTVIGLTLKQHGFHPAETALCVRVSANAELCLNDCDVTSESSVGILVADGALVMDNSRTVLCGGSGMIVQEGGHATATNCKFVSNWMPNITQAEKDLHEMFIAFCKGETAHSFARRQDVESHSDKQQIKLSALGKRSTTLDFFEFLEVLKYLKIYPSLVTKTEASKIFETANQTEAADENASEMDWIEFKGLMHTLCGIINSESIMGVSRDELVPKASDREEAWKSSNGIIVRGSGSRLQVNTSEFMNCIDGCVVKKGASAEINECKFLCCGRDRTDAAGLVVSGKGSSASCKASEFDTSDHHGVKADGQGQVQMHSCKIFKIEKQGILAVGRGTNVVVDECEIMNIGNYGLRANQNGCIQVMNTAITKCLGAGILASFLGTAISVKGGVTLRGNGAQSHVTKEITSCGIVAENEGAVFIVGQNAIDDQVIARRQGRIEQPNQRHSRPHTPAEPDVMTKAVEFVSEIVTAAETSVLNSTSESLKPRRRSNKYKNKPETEKLMVGLSEVFDNAAEAFVMLDIDAGGGLSLPELHRGLQRLNISDVDMDALSEELKLQPGAELDVDAFIHYFMWHDMDVFPESSWEMGFVEASRQRRRIAQRFYERSGMDNQVETVHGSNWKEKLISDEMTKRLRLQEAFHTNWLKKMKKGDHRAERKKGVQYIKGGRVYRSGSKLRSGEAETKYVASFGLPGAPSQFRDPSGATLAKRKVDCWMRSEFRGKSNSVRLFDVSSDETRVPE